MRVILILTAALAALLCASCGGSEPTDVDNPIPVAITQPQGPQGAALPQFPLDSQLPGEELDAAGLVLPQRNAIASALDVNDEFQAGRDFIDDSGSVSKAGAAASLQSAGGSSAWVLHRFPLVGSEPGILSVDANLGPDDEYYVGAANFSSGRWEWHGPFNDSHVRVPLDSASSYLSGLGNAWTAVLSYDGSAIELVSVALAMRAIGDSDAPAMVTGVGGPVRGGRVDLSWDPVADGDLAGYALYYSDQPFNSQNAVGVRSIGYLEGTTRHMLELDPGVYNIRVAAVDRNGNIGQLSSNTTADIQGSSSEQLTLTTASTLVPVGGQISITVSGAELYDVDLDGDGVFETTDSSDTVFSMQADSAGVVRSRVRGRDVSDTYTALAGLSVLVNIGNLPPYADFFASSTNVAIGQEVAFFAFNSSDLDGTVDQYEWDFNGDSVIDLDTGTTASATHSFDSAGIFAVQLRVTDDDGDSSVALAAVTVRGGDFNIIAESGGSQNMDMAIVNGKPAIAFTNNVGDRPWYQQAATPAGNQWNNPVKVFDGDDCSSSVSLAVVNGNPALTFYNGVAQRGMYVRATDADGTAWGAAVEYNPGTNTGFHSDLTVINGNPAIVHNANSLLQYSRSSDSNGTAWNAAVTIDNSAGAGLSAVLLDTFERPLSVFIRLSDVPTRWVSCDGDDADGTTWGSVLTGGDTDLNNAIELDAIMTPVGSLAAYIANDNGWHELRAKYLRNVHINQWLAPVPVLRSDNIGDVKLGMAGGLPFIVYSEETNHSRLVFVPALDQYGYGWGDPVILHAADEQENYVFAVEEVFGLPVVAYKPGSENFVYYGFVYH